MPDSRVRAFKRYHGLPLFIKKFLKFERLDIRSNLKKGLVGRDQTDFKKSICFFFTSWKWNTSRGYAEVWYHVKLHNSAFR